MNSLRGVRVLDLTRMLAGPYGTMLLADLGAEVLKVERPGTGDEIRAVGPHFVGGESVYFLSVNRGKRSVAIDLARPEGRALLQRLAAGCDVVVENFRAGVAERLGCDAATLHALNSRLIICGITAFGRTGPDRDLPAFDLTLQARGGMMALTGEPDGAPVRCGVPMGDLAGGLFSALAVSAALYERERTGLGRFIDLSLLDCQVGLLTYAAGNWLMAGDDMGPQGSGHAHATPYQRFATRDGHLVVAVFTDAFWPGFCRAIDRPEWAADPAWATNAARRARLGEALALIGQRLSEEGTEHWLARLYAEGVPAGPVQRVSAVCADPQVIARGMIATMQHPAAGEVRAAGDPLRAGEGERAGFRAAPLLGADTDAVLGELLGMTAGEIGSLRSAGVVG
ncbi:MAG: Formyl-CoA transferase [Myxococcaceae bacterium]|nr:Formyl-CoA transferase [Myxococcaceae bacterium]